MKDKDTYCKRLGEWFLSPFLQLGTAYLSPTFLPYIPLHSVQKTKGISPLNNTCILTREWTSQRERGKTKRQPERKTERGSINGLEATLLALTKGGRGIKTSGVNMLFHSLSQTVSQHQLDSSSWLLKRQNDSDLSRGKPMFCYITNMTTALCFNKKISYTTKSRMAFIMASR